MNTNIYRKWAIESAKNAIQLSEEARILLQADHYSRAYYLAHMSTEESAKTILLQTMSISGTPISELKKVSSLLRNHKKKIEFLISYAESTSGELRDSLINLKDELISHINNLKNNTMYVSCKKKKLILPEENIKSVNVEDYVNLAEKLSAYVKMQTDPPLKTGGQVKPISNK